MPKNAVKMWVFQKEWVLKQYIFDEKQNIVQYYYTRIGLFYYAEIEFEDFAL